MPRRRKYSQGQLEAAEALRGSLPAPRRQRRPRPPRRDQLRKVEVEMEEMFSQDDWSEARASHVVMLFRRCHQTVYGVDVEGLVSRHWKDATRAAGLLASRSFGGSFERVVAFMRWVWKREAEREAWRRKHGREGGTISWRAMFGRGQILTDYKIDRERRRSAKRRS